MVKCKDRSSVLCQPLRRLIAKRMTQTRSVALPSSNAGLAPCSNSVIAAEYQSTDLSFLANYDRKNQNSHQLSKSYDAEMEILALATINFFICLSPNTVAFDQLACSSKPKFPGLGEHVVIRRTVQTSCQVSRQYDGRAIFKLMFEAMIRASERWRSVRVTNFERLHMEVLRRDLGGEIPEADQTRPFST